MSQAANGKPDRQQTRLLSSFVMYTMVACLTSDHSDVDRWVLLCADTLLSVVCDTARVADFNVLAALLCVQGLRH